jgi:nifR3 family TIM-barrel protein
MFLSQSTPALLLAPMADVTNPAFRRVCMSHGADFAYTEMIHTDGFLNGDPYAQHRGYSIDNLPYGIQIVGSNASSIAKTAKGLEQMFSPIVKVIDINMGCPSPPIVKTGCGAALLSAAAGTQAHPEVIIQKVTQAIETPVSAKIRIYRSPEKTIELAKMIERAGASVLTIHGRTKEQGYSGKADWDVVRQIKKELGIPIILNGDIFAPKDLGKAIEKTNCNGYMIGRGAVGNPFLFKKMKHFLETGEPLILTEAEEFAQRLSDFKAYAALLSKHNLLPYTNVKAHAQWFTKGLAMSGEMRLQINLLHKDIKIRNMSDEELTEERRMLAESIFQIFEDGIEKQERT